jgi:hypothetical protein
MEDVPKSRLLRWEHCWEGVSFWLLRLGDEYCEVEWGVEMGRLVRSVVGVLRRDESRVVWCEWSVSFELLLLVVGMADETELWDELERVLLSMFV